MRVDKYSTNKAGYMALSNTAQANAKQLLTKAQNGPKARYTHKTWPPLSGIMHDISAVNMASGTDHKIGNMNNPTTINFGPPLCNIASKPNGPCYPSTHITKMSTLLLKKFKN